MATALQKLMAERRVKIQGDEDSEESSAVSVPPTPKKKKSKTPVKKEPAKQLPRVGLQQLVFGQEKKKSPPRRGRPVQIPPALLPKQEKEKKMAEEESESESESEEEAKVAPVPPSFPPTAGAKKKEDVKVAVVLVPEPKAVIAVKNEPPIVVSIRRPLSGSVCAPEFAVLQPGLQAVMLGYFLAYQEAISDVYLHDVEQLWGLSFLHPADYVEWKSILAEFAELVLKKDASEIANTPPCSVEQYASVQKKWARLSGELEERYAAFRNNALYGETYRGNLDNYCRTIKQKSCGGKVGPCTYSQGGFFSSKGCRRKPRNAEAKAYLQRHPQMHVTKDCFSKRGLFQHKARHLFGKLENEVTAAEQPGVAAFLNHYITTYLRILVELAADMKALRDGGFLYPFDFDEMAKKAESVGSGLKMSSEDRLLGHFIDRQERWNNDMQFLLFEYRQLRHKALHSKAYRKNLDQFCRTMKQDKTQCERFPACNYSTKKGWFSSPGCRNEGATKSGKEYARKNPEFKTSEDC